MTTFLKKLISPDSLFSIESPPRIFLTLAAPIGILIVLGIIMEATQDNLNPQNNSNKKSKRSKSKNNNKEQEQPKMEVESSTIQSDVDSKVELNAQKIDEKPKIIEDGNSSAEDTLISNACEAVKLTLRSSREAEKNLLILLNKRFANIIEKNRQLEQANQKLTTEFELSEQKYAATVTELTTKINSQVQEARAELAIYKKENQNLIFDVNNLKKEQEELQSQLEKAVNLNGTQQKTISELDSKVSKLETDLKKETGNKSKFQKELNDLKDEKKKLLNRLSEVTKQYEEECLAKVELEGQLKGEVEEVHMKASVVQSEMLQMKAHTEEQLKNMDAQHLKEYEKKLENCMSNLRYEYNKKLQENKKEQEKLYSMKESEHNEMIKSLQSDLDVKVQDLQTIEIQVEELITKMSKLEGEKQELRVRLDATEFEKKSERERLLKEVEAKKKLLQEVRDQKERLVGEYSDLLDIKVALDTELATYKALLETEESRLHITLADLVKDENDNILLQHMVEVQ